MDIETFGNTNNGDSYVAVDEDVKEEKEDGAHKKEEGDMNRVREQLIVLLWRTHLLTLVVLRL